MKKTKKKIYVGSLILKILIILAAIFTIVMLGYLIVYILGKGIPHLTPSLFSLHYDSDNVSMLPSIINTLIMIGVALLIAVPIGVFSAVYLTEYAKKGNKLVKNHQNYSRNINRYSVHRLRFVRYVVLRNRMPYVLLLNGRYFNCSDHGFANRFKNHRGSTFGSAGQLP